MGSRMPAEQRFFQRYLSVKGTFGGRLFHGGHDLGGRILDVSRDGLGALLDVAVAVRDTVELRFDGRTIVFVVVHCHEDLIHRGKHRVGLHRTGSAENLVSLFRAAGHLADS